MNPADDLSRYARHLSLPGFGEAAQRKLRNSKVLVIGAGGLGAPVLSYLAAAGVGHLGVVDHDLIERSNLQRQVLFTSQDVGQSKALTAESRLRLLNPGILIESFNFKLTRINAIGMISPFDLVVDCTDNFPTRYLINDACILAGKPYVYGSVFRFEGQLSVFNFQGGPTYRDLYPAAPSPGAVMNCEEAGVLGVLTGIVGTLQANEVIKMITGIGEVISAQLLLIDSLTLDITKIKIPDKNQGNMISGLIDYEHFCGVPRDSKENDIMKEVTVQELKQMKDSGMDFQLIDVREPHEYEICDIGGELIPMAEVPSNVDRISKDKQVIIHCRSGKRSSDILLWLEKNQGFENLYNLKGGILAWAKEIDPDMPTY